LRGARAGTLVYDRPETEDDAVPNMLRIGLVLAGINGFLAVAAGAFGAHGVSDPQVAAWLRTGSQYEAVHAAAALACYAIARRTAGPLMWAAVLFGLGGLVFGGTLYLLGLTGVRFWGAITPIGGVLMLVGWAAVIWAALQASDHQS